MRTCTRSSRRPWSMRHSASSRASFSPSEPTRIQEQQMSLVDVKVPQLSESVAEATLLQWKKKAGEAVAQDEILIEIETDKVVLEVPAPSAGVLAEIVAGDGATVAAEQVIAKIDTAGKASAAAPAAAAAAAKPA